MGFKGPFAALGRRVEAVRQNFDGFVRRQAEQRENRVLSTITCMSKCVSTRLEAL